MKVYTQDEYDELYRKFHRKDIDYVLKTCGESYVVKFTHQKEDGFWTTSEVMYHTSRKGQHEQVEKRCRKQYPKANLISVIYQ